ncbi:MerR family transcriptional regulator [Glycomyces artemisiae]|uniref:MerR-like DNA binding protein n=1 Tax=Glycomyces artemisiae TaxID=1076443 RepID=A0A2T0UE48_9ACTN|nr:MerR family transcriptional regulator [Glycomyces artemisiae]PRY56216.1 MerR-like DNA binding protein [Glycomyces artemisiae]
MRIGELSARTGVPAATIKYYVREGLLSGGERRGHNQVEYGEEHVRRLRLVRAMVEVGSVPIAKVREVLTEIEDPRRDLDSTLGVASRALSQHKVPAEEPAAVDVETAKAIVRGRGWNAVPLEHGYVWTLADAIGRLRELGLGDMVDMTGEYARAAEIVAEFDLALLQMRSDRDEILEAMVVGTVLGDAIFEALRRIAQVEVSSRVYPPAQRESVQDEEDSSTGE